MIQTMRALCKSKPERGIWMIEAPVPAFGADQVLIRVHHTAICGTDMLIFNWDDWAAQHVPTPLITGHEFAGEIVEIGSAVTRNLRIGQRVSAEGHVISLDSDAARAGQFHLDPGTKGIGVTIQGAFADYVAVPAFNVVALPDSVSTEVAAMLDPFGNAVHTALKTDLVARDVLVTGAGPIGIMAAAVARHVGARRVVLTDINDYRLALAAKHFDVECVNVAREDIKDVKARLGIEAGFDVAMEMSGAEPAIHQALEHLKMGGALTLLGLPSKPGMIDWSQVILKALTLRGVYGREMFETWRQMLGLLEAGFPLERLITHRFKADDFADGFAAMGSGQSGKVILSWL